MGGVVFEILLRSSIQLRPARPEAGFPAQSAYTKSHSLPESGSVDEAGHRAQLRYL